MKGFSYNVICYLAWQVCQYFVSLALSRSKNPEISLRQRLDIFIAKYVLYLHKLGKQRNINWLANMKTFLDVTGYGVFAVNVENSG